MSLIKYKVSTIPSDAFSIQFGISNISPTSLTVKVDSLADFQLLLEPDGNVAEKIFSGIVWPVAQFLATFVPSEVKKAVEGQSLTKNFDQPIGYSFSVEGVEVKVEAETLQLSNYNGMLMATGTVKVS